MALLKLFGQSDEQSWLIIIMTRFLKSCHSAYVEVRDLLMSKPLPRDSAYWGEVQTIHDSCSRITELEKAKKKAAKKAAKKLRRLK